MNAIEVRGLTKRYGKATVLDAVDLDVRAGSIHALLGPNGAGKTTLVRILATLLRPDGGRASVAGHDVVRAAPAVRRSISLTGQYAAVDELLTGEENLRMMGRLNHLTRAQARQRAEALLERFDLVGARRRRVSTYSGGMRRRLDLAVSLIRQPVALFLDEPTTGLDLSSRLTVWSGVRDLAAEGVTVLLTTQYLEEADQLADHVTVLDGGRVVAGGTSDALKRQVAGGRLELALASEGDLEAALALDGWRVLASDRGRLTAAIATDGGVPDVRRLLDHADRAGLSVTGMTVTAPTLDDVFLQLTGGAR